MLIHAQTTRGRRVNCSSTVKPCPAEISEYSPPGLRALEDADHQYVTVLFPPKSHTKLYGINSLPTINGPGQVWLRNLPAETSNEWRGHACDFLFEKTS